MENNNTLKFRRNDMTGVMSVTKDMIVEYLTEQIYRTENVGDGQIILGRYKDGDGQIKSLIGISHNGRTASGNKAGMTIIDSEGGVSEERVSEIAEEKAEAAVEGIDAENIEFSFTNPERTDRDVESALNTLENETRSIEMNYVKNVSGKDAVMVTASTNPTGGKDSTVSLKINSGDKVLSQNSNGLSANVTLSYDKTTQTLSIKGNDGAIVGSGVDMSDFLKDNMLENVELITPTPENPIIIHGLIVKEGMYLKFTWNVSGENKPLYVDMTEWMGEILKVEYKEGNGIKIDGEHRISVDLSDDSTTVNYLYINDAGELAFKQEEIERLIEESGAGGYSQSYLKYLSTLFLPLSGGTMGGNIHMSGSNGVAFGGEIRDYDEPSKRGNVKLSEKDGGLAISVNDGTGNFVEKSGMDSDGELYMVRNGVVEIVDETYLRKSDYQESGKTFVYETTQALDEGHLTLLKSDGYCVVSVIATIGKIEDIDSDESVLVADKVVEDIIWVDRDGKGTYCSKNEDIYTCVESNNYVKLCFKDGLDVMRVECKVIQGECDFLCVGETGWTRNVYPELGMMHHIKETVSPESDEERTFVTDDSHRFPVYEIFSTTDACVVEVSVNVGNTVISDTIHYQKDNSGKQYRTVYSEDNYGCFKWKMDGNTMRVYFCQFSDNKYPKHVYYRVLFERERGCVSESFNIAYEGDDFYAPVLRSCEIDKTPTVHVKGGNELLDAIYLLTNGVYNPYGRIVLEDSIQINWMCTHTIGEKPYYQTFVRTDVDRRTLEFKNDIGSITIECASDNVKIFNISGIYENEYGKIAMEAAFTTTIKGKGLSFKNANFGRQPRTEVTASTAEGLVVGEYTEKTDKGGNIYYSVRDGGEKIAKVTNSTFVDQKRSMFEVGEKLTMENCKLSIQGLMDEIDGVYVNQTSYTFNNPLVKVFGTWTDESKAAGERQVYFSNCEVRLTNCDFTCPFENLGGLSVDDSIKVATAINNGQTKSCNVVIDGCNVVCDDHKMSNDSVVKLTNAYVLTGGEGTAERSYTKVTGISEDCVYNVHRDSMKAVNEVEEDVVFHGLPEESAGGDVVDSISVTDENGGIVNLNGDVKIVSSNRSITVKGDPTGNAVNIEVYEPGGKVYYADNLYEFLDAVYTINKVGNGASGNIKVTNPIPLNRIMNSELGYYTLSDVETGILNKLKENVISGDDTSKLIVGSVGDSISGYCSGIVSEDKKIAYTDLTIPYIDFGSLLDNIKIEGVTPSAVIKTMPVKTQYVSNNPRIPICTYGTLIGNCFSFENIKIGRGNSEDDEYNQNDPANKGSIGDTASSTSTKFIVNHQPFFKVKCKFMLKGCYVTSQNCLYESGGTEGKGIAISDGFNWMNYEETKYDSFDTGITLVDVYDILSNGKEYGGGGKLSGVTIDIKDCNMTSIGSYTGDAKTNVQNQISIKAEPDVHKTGRDLTISAIFTNTRVLQSFFGHTHKSMFVVTEPENQASRKSTVSVVVYKGNVEYDSTNSKIGDGSETSKVQLVTMP